ncbi:MAG TPA: dihydrodipicolinate synthase family protein [Xanthobacteraceae bacterium]|jgi:4-hydroxy-tetrahydrodipicolinate synthase
MVQIRPNANGVYIISVTPFTEQGDIDWASTDSLVEFYISKGVSGVTILGMMGEAHKLAENESTAFAKYFIERVAGRVPVIVGVSNAGVDSLVHLAKSVMDFGAGGVMIAPAAGLKTEVQIRDYFATVFKRLGPSIPVCFQDYPLGTGANISVPAFLQLVDDQPSLVMFKHEDWPGLKKLQQLRRACDGQARRRISILCGNGGLYLPQELHRGADGAMTGFAYPEMLVDVCKTFFAGRGDEAEDIFDVYLPLVRHEQQIGIGLAIRKEILRRRGAIRSAAVRLPGPRLDNDDLEELDRLMHRLERRLLTMHGRSGIAA